MVVYQSHFNIPLLEQTLCSYSFKTDAAPHRQCLVESCIDRNGELCLVGKMKRYLDSRYTLLHEPDFKHLEKKSDFFMWHHL